MGYGKAGEITSAFSTAIVRGALTSWSRLCCLLRHSDPHGEDRTAQASNNLEQMINYIVNFLGGFYGTSLKIWKFLKKGNSDLRICQRKLKTLPCLLAIQGSEL